MPTGRRRSLLAVGGQCEQRFLDELGGDVVPSVRKVESKRERAIDTEFTDADVPPKDLRQGSTQPTEPVSFTNIVHSPSSAAPQRGKPRSALVGGLIAAIWRRLFSRRAAKKEASLLDFARRGKW